MNRTTTAARNLLIGYLAATTPTDEQAAAIQYVPATNTANSEYHVTVGKQVVVFTRNIYTQVFPVYVRTQKVSTRSWRDDDADLDYGVFDETARAALVESDALRGPLGPLYRMPGT